MKAKVIFDDEKCIVMKEDKNKNMKEYVIGRCIGGKLYCVGSPHPTDSAFFTSTPVSKDIWHYRLGHLNRQDVNRLIGCSMVEGVTVAKSSKNNENKESLNVNCEGCLLGKMSKVSFPKKSMNRATKRLELIHTDLCGPMQIESHAGSKYVLTFMDDFTRYCNVFTLFEAKS